MPPLPPGDFAIFVQTRAVGVWSGLGQRQLALELGQMGGHDHRINGREAADANAL